MADPRIILYYGFAPVADPETLKLWQKTLCESLNLTGRILISKHGINGTLGGESDDLKKYIKETKFLGTAGSLSLLPKNKYDNIFITNGDVYSKVNFKNILIITGKGLRSKVKDNPYLSEDLSLLRYAVPNFIKNKFADIIKSIEESDQSLGGSGAFMLRLKKRL